MQPQVLMLVILGVLSRTLLLIMTWPFVCVIYTKYGTVQVTARSCNLVYTLVGFA